MLIIGCDFHTRYQQIAMAEDSTKARSDASGTRTWMLVPRIGFESMVIIHLPTEAFAHADETDGSALWFDLTGMENIAGILDKIAKTHGEGMATSLQEKCLLARDATS
jgi:hypothetical protein